MSISDSNQEALSSLDEASYSTIAYDSLSGSSNSNTTTPITTDTSGRSSPQLIVPSVPVATVTMTTATGPNSLPVLGQRSAPAKFKGRYDKVKHFLQHYEKLCALRSVTLDKDKIENITQYCSREVREFMEGLPSYSDNNWANFSRDVLKYYDAERDSKRYRVRDLEAYVLSSRRKPKFKDLSVWKKYNRGFIRIAGWLMQKDKLIIKDRDLYFWKGIPREFRQRLEARLLSRYPDHDINNPWSMEQVSKIAEGILQRSRFDHERLPSDTESDDDLFPANDSSSDDSDSSDSDSSDDNHTRHKRKYDSKRHKKHRKSSKTSRLESDEEDKPSIKSKPPQSSQVSSPKETKQKAGEMDGDIEELINRLNRMSVNDSEYAGLYLRACQKNPLVKEVLESLTKQRNNMAIASSQKLPSRTFNQSIPSTNASMPLSDECYFCKESGHIASKCPLAGEYVSKGILTRDRRGHYIMRNGSRINRANNETLAQAVARSIAPKSNYIAVNRVNHIMVSDEEDYGYDYY